MAHITTHRFVCNGWNLSMQITTENQKPVSDKIKIRFTIIGLTSGNALFNIDTRTMFFEKPVIVAPYKQNGNYKQINKLLISKEVTKQIKIYLS